MHGYAAVHVIVFPEDVPIEIQVRTRWQHEWADLFEKLADRVGRGIRYGEPPVPWPPPDQFKTDPSVLQELQAASDHLRVVTVETAITFAALISAVEEAEVEMPKSAQLDDYRQRVREGLADLRQDLNDYL
jgi:ppGpp synthetase/RelA/SpoT-type nucleotidyltranferase